MTRVNAWRVFFVPTLISLLAVTAPSSLARTDQWNKHIKAARQDFSEGVSEKYFHAWGEARPYPHFAKAEEELLAACRPAAQDAVCWRIRFSTRTMSAGTSTLTAS